MTGAERNRLYRERHRDDPEFKARNIRHALAYQAKNKDNPEYKRKRYLEHLKWRLEHREDENYREYMNNWMKEWRENPENKKRVSEWTSRKNRNPVQVKAHKAVLYAVRSGKLVPPESCPQCGFIPSVGRLQAHHEDYSKPLEVTWLCHKCHGKTWRKYA